MTKETNNIIGYPIDRSHWNTMKEILTSITWMKEHNNNSRYSLAIDMEKELYKDYLRKYLTAA